MGITDIGAQLRSSREALGLSIASLAQRTCVQPRIIAAIENNDLASIPPKPYGRGFIRTYAREVGLDPEQAVHDYFGQFPPTATDDGSAHRQAESWPSRGSLLVPAGALAAVIVLLAFFQGDTTDAVDNRVPAAVGTSGAAADVARPNATLGSATDRESSSRDANTRESQISRDANQPGLPGLGTAGQDASRVGAGITLALGADRECWVTASADGERVLYELMKPGTQRTIRAARDVTLRAGDAGALRLTVNGRSIGTFGDDGSVRSARITADTAATFTGRQ